MEIQLSLAALRRLLFVAVIVLSACGLAAELAANIGAWPDPHGLVPFFSLSYETNLPTWYSVTVLFSAGAVLALIALAKRRERAPFVLQWAVLSLTFLYISLDEMVQLHEHMTGWFDFGGVLYFDWVVPAAVMVALWGAAFVPFVRHLPSPTRNQVLLAGTLYVAGALLLELPLGWWTERHGNENLGYGVIDWIEETLEMSGMSLFLYALVRYVAGPADRVRI